MCRLTIFISKFKKQTVDKMLSLEDKELGSLTKTQIETLKDYTGSAYDSFNAYLRQKAAGKAYTGYLSKDSIDELEDAVEAFSKIKTKEDYVLRRGTDSDDLAALNAATLGTGGDADTIAAIACSLAGAHVGLS